MLYDDKAASPAEVAMKLADRKKAGEELAVAIKAKRAAEHGMAIDLVDAVRQVGVLGIAATVKHLE